MKRVLLNIAIAFLIHNNKFWGPETQNNIIIY